MYLIYSFLLGIWMLLMLPVLWWRSVFKKKAFPGIAERLGRLPDALRSDGRVAIWMHACSVGETLSLQPLIEGLAARYPESRLVLSTTTQGGNKVAREKYTKIVGDRIFYFPVDQPAIVRRVLSTIKPAILIIVDTEIWPNLLREARRCDIPVVLVNGRISDKSFRWYRWLSCVLAPVLACYRMILTKDQVDADRLRQMGAPASRVLVSGNMKYDVAVSDVSGERRQALDLALGISATPGPVIVAGSTHEGEEELLFAALALLREKPATASVRLLLAPRHIERTESVIALAQKYGLSVSRRSENSPAHAAAVMLLDTHGELAAAYQFADVAFVGGTVAPIGGHSIMEPALFGKAIVVGPHMENFGNMVDEFIQAGALIQIVKLESTLGQQAERFAEKFEMLLTDPARATAMGHAASEIFEKSKGATKIAINAISQILEDAQS